MHFKKNHTPLPTLGFGLIEMMVSITIITLVSAVIIAKHNAFNGAVLLRNQAYEVAFAIRQAQLLAVSGSTPAGDAVPRYGVFFDRDTPNVYRLFRDDNDDGLYKDSDDVLIGPAGVIDKRFQIRNIYFNNSTSVGNGTNNNLFITFKRPNFDARFRRSTGSAVSGDIYIDIARVGESGNSVGAVRRVEVTSTGQISVVTY